MKKENFDYEKYINFDATPYKVEFTEDGYNITVGCQTTDFSDKFDKAGAQILKNVAFHIAPKGKKNKWELVGYGKYQLQDLNELQRSKLEILKRQMPTFFQKYSEARPEQFALFARNILRPMRDSHCMNRLKSVEAKLFQIA